MLTQEEQIFKQIKKANNILISFSRSLDGDSVASSLAFFLFLKKIGKNVDIVTKKNHSLLANNIKLQSLKFLPAFRNIKYNIEKLKKIIIGLDISQAKIKKAKYEIKDNILNFILYASDKSFIQKTPTLATKKIKYDLIIVLDTPDLDSLGEIYDDNAELFYHTPIINIDHNSHNEEFGQINFIEITAVSTTEILFSLFDSYDRKKIDDDIATCLLAGMFSKTKSFKTNNITPKALLTASKLVSIGARKEEIINKFYRSKSIGSLKLWGRVLANIHSDLENKFIWSKLSHIDFIRTQASENDIFDLVDELLVNIPQAMVLAIMYKKINEKENKKIEKYLLLYTRRNINALSLVQEYKAKGDRKIVKVYLDKFSEQEIISNIKNKLSKLNF